MGVKGTGISVLPLPGGSSVSTFEVELLIEFTLWDSWKNQLCRNPSSYA